MIRRESTSPFSALVVERDGPDAVLAVSALTRVGFTVTLASSFDKARQLIDRDPPLVLITEIRPGEPDGLQLTAGSMAARRPPIAVVVASEVPDTGLQRDAERIGATFVQKPVTAADLVAAVFRTALRKPAADGAVEPVRPPFERRYGDRRAASTRIGDLERRRVDRRRDIQGLLVRAAAMS